MTLISHSSTLCSLDVSSMQDGIEQSVCVLLGWSRFLDLSQDTPPHPRVIFISTKVLSSYHENQSQVYRSRRCPHPGPYSCSGLRLMLTRLQPLLGTRLRTAAKPSYTVTTLIALPPRSVSSTYCSSSQRVYTVDLRLESRNFPIHICGTVPEHLNSPSP